MLLTRRAALGATAATLVFGPARAQPAETIRIGVLTDLSGPYRDVTGPTSVACVRQAVEEFTAQTPSVKVEVIAADHQNKPDVGINTVRQWLDTRGVDVVTDVGNSAIALGINPVCVERDRIHLNASAATSDLTGRACTPSTIHWSYDTWCFAKTSGDALTRMGGDTWYFVTADYAFGHAIQRDTTRFIEAAGGRVVGDSKYPFPQTTDFSAFLLQAQASRAKVLGVANAGADTVNTVKQAYEFGLTRRGMRLAVMVMFISDVHAIGMQTAQGLVRTSPYYWDLNDRTRAFDERVRSKTPGNRPGMLHAGCYAGTLHYLKAVLDMGAAAAKADGAATIARMKAMPTDDDCFGQGRIREDGRKIHPAYLFEVKKPEESRGPWDYYKQLSVVPAEEAFRPMDQGRCPLVRS